MRRVDGHDLANDQPIEQVRNAASRCLTEGAASSRVPASIHARVMDDKPMLPYQA